MVDLRSALYVYKHFYLQARRDLTVDRALSKSPVIIRKVPRNKENIPLSLSTFPEVIDLASDEANASDVVNLISDSDDSLSPVKVRTSLIL